MCAKMVVVVGRVAWPAAGMSTAGEGTLVGVAAGTEGREEEEEDRGVLLRGAWVGRILKRAGEGTAVVVGAGGEGEGGDVCMWSSAVVPLWAGSRTGDDGGGGSVRDGARKDVLRSGTGDVTFPSFLFRHPTQCAEMVSSGGPSLWWWWVVAGGGGGAFPAWREVGVERYDRFLWVMEKGVMGKEGGKEKK